MGDNYDDDDDDYDSDDDDDDDDGNVSKCLFSKDDISNIIIWPNLKNKPTTLKNI